MKHWLASLASAFFALSLALAVSAAVEVEQLSDSGLQARYQVLIEELRCPKCQNQNLAGSDSPVAGDLRRELRRLLEEGFTDEQITEYMVARYGDFVLYRPPLQRNTLLLWVAPGVFAAIGLLALITIVARSRSGTGARQDNAAPGLSEEERRRLQQLLGSGDDEGLNRGLSSEANRENRKHD